MVSRYRVSLGFIGGRVYSYRYSLITVRVTQRNSRNNNFIWQDKDSDSRTNTYASYKN